MILLYILFIQKKNNEIILSDKNIEVKSLKVLQKLLPNFGDLIVFLEIEFENIEQNKATEIVKSVNEHTSNTLRLLYLIDCYGNVLDELKNQFKEVIAVLFSVAENFEFSDKDQRLNKIFPNLQLFLVGKVSAVQWKYVDVEFPSLNNFYIVFIENEINETHVASFLKKNPQIKAFEINDPSLKVLKEVNDNLPNLISLEINGLSKNYGNDKIDSVHFKNVKKIAIRTQNENEIPEKIGFHQVNNITLNINTTFSDKWFDFIANKIHSKVIYFKLETKSLTKDQLLNLPEKLPDLTEVALHSPVEFAADDVIHFIEKVNHLQILQIFIEMDKNEQDKFKNKFKDDKSVSLTPYQDGVVIKIVR